MDETLLRNANRIASAIRKGDSAQVRKLLTDHPECRVFLDLPETVASSGLEAWSDYAEKYGHRDFASMLNGEFADPVLRGICDAVSLGDVEGLRRFFEAHPRYIRLCGDGLEERLIDAAYFGHINVAGMMLEMGADINHRRFRTDTALSSAIGFAGPEMVEFLLRRGADPKIASRPIIGAINREPEDLALRLVQLLVEYGADVNQEFDIFGDATKTFTALEWAHGKPSIIAYLKSKGAIERTKNLPGKATPKTLAEEVVAYFDEHFGPPRPQAQIEIVPSEPRIAIHLIPAAEDRKHVTLFTTGMSKHAMQVPDGTDDFRFAELFMQLPGDWPTDQKSLSNLKHAWPLQWLRSVAQYPRQNQTWLGGPVTIIANEDPPQPLAPGLRFTSLLVMADQTFTSRDGRTIYLYRLTPLYTEERALEIKEGIGALLRAFDKFEISSVVDLNRPNVALQS